MAALKFILQAVTPSTHAKLVRDLLNQSESAQVLISVAFLREDAIDAISSALKLHAAHTRIFVGIRNDITSIQAVKRLLQLKTTVYAVDTGSRHVIFHPKLYLVADDVVASMIIGSANMTFSGLHNNIELSVLVTLDLSVESDNAFADEVVETFDALLQEHPKHAFQIVDEKHAQELFESGRLADETIVPAPSPSSEGKTGKQDALPRMDLWRTKHPKPKLPKALESKKKKVGQVASGGGAASTVPTTVKYKVWESKPLVERDLTIPHSVNTNPTGSMGWKKGAFDGIDQRHYFRDEVFADLKWVADPAPSKKERAEANFELIIKNVSYGVFPLRLSHNTNKKSVSYKQKNFMTQLHWGLARSLIAKKNLLGRTLYLYRKDTAPPEFTIEID